MSAEVITKSLSELLVPQGFRRKNRCWNRNSGSYVDVIDVQISKSRDMLTVNIGVLDPIANRQLWGSDHPPVVEAAFCTVQSRIGQLMGDRDVWWPVDDSGTRDQIVEAVTTHALPFLGRMHSDQAMEEALVVEAARSGGYPPPTIYLAILINRRGDHLSACEMLGTLEKRSVGAWSARIHDVAERLDCR